MSAPVTVPVQFDPDEYEQLAADARRRGVGPDALGRLAHLRADLRRDGSPTADAVRVFQEGRTDLDSRN